MRERPRKICAHCGRDYIEGDLFCRFCGAELGEPAFTEDPPPCVYGPPPVRRMHVCEKCGYSWQTCQMIDRARWCPRCGGAAPVTNRESAWN